MRHLAPNTLRYSATAARGFVCLGLLAFALAARNAVAQPAPVEPQQTWLAGKEMFVELAGGIAALGEDNVAGDPGTSRVAPYLSLAAGPIIDDFLLAGELAWLPVSLDQAPDVGPTTVDVPSLGVSVRHALFSWRSFVVLPGLSAGLAVPSGWFQTPQSPEATPTHHPSRFLGQVGGALSVWWTRDRDAQTNPARERALAIERTARGYQSACSEKPNDPHCRATAQTLTGLVSPEAGGCRTPSLPDPNVLSEPQLVEILSYAGCLQLETPPEPSRFAIGISARALYIHAGDLYRWSVPITFSFVL